MEHAERFGTTNRHFNTKALNLWVAIPDSTLSDEQCKREKSVKIAQIARACSIFRVKRIYIFHDKVTRFEKDDPELLKTILQYLDTPQYLRKILYPRMSALEYAGLLHPIKAPHHMVQDDLRQIKPGSVRAAVIVKVKGKFFVEAGFRTLVPFHGDGLEGKKINIRIISSFPNLQATQADDQDIIDYWGYNVLKMQSLHDLLKASNDTTVILTSRQGESFAENETRIKDRVNRFRNLLVVFGAPRRGIQELLASEGYSTDSSEFIVNMFPQQGTETVRLEEAMHGCLAIINYCFSKC